MDMWCFHSQKASPENTKLVKRKGGGESTGVGKRGKGHTYTGSEANRHKGLTVIGKKEKSRGGKKRGGEVSTGLQVPDRHERNGRFLVVWGGGNRAGVFGLGWIFGFSRKGEVWFGGLLGKKKSMAMFTKELKMMGDCNKMRKVRKKSWHSTKHVKRRSSPKGITYKTGKHLREIRTGGE